MADVSDGLLIDARRMADASGLGVRIDLDAIPLSDSAVVCAGDGRAARLAAATAGDDYELLLAASAEKAAMLLTFCQSLGLRLTVVGSFAPGAGLGLSDGGGPVPLPSRLGYEHGAREG